MTIDEMNKKKKEYGYSYEYIAEKSGVPLSTVQKVLGGITTAPRRATIEALCNVFISAKSQDQTLTAENSNGICCVCEDGESYYSTDGSNALKADSFAYNKKSKKYLNLKADKTIADYLALPEGTRAELIDGVLYDLASPTADHQGIIPSLLTAFSQYIDSNNGKCLPYSAPMDVQLDCDDKTMVQPDVMVVCDRDKIKKNRIVGAPDLVVEILSPATWNIDMGRKLVKYKKAGVREYWIINIESLEITVYYFEKSDLPELYSFFELVPVNIWDGKCKVDFKKIYEKISFLLETE